MKPIAVSMGEPAGIGPEIILAAWRARAIRPPRFLCCGRRGFVQGAHRRRNAAQLPRSPRLRCRHPFRGGACRSARATRRPRQAGQARHAQCRRGHRCDRPGCRRLPCGTARALVTAPIHKATLYRCRLCVSGAHGISRAPRAGRRPSAERLDAAGRRRSQGRARDHPHAAA